MNQYHKTVPYRPWSRMLFLVAPIGCWPVAVVLLATTFYTGCGRLNVEYKPEERSTGPAVIGSADTSINKSTTGTSDSQTAQYIDMPSVTDAGGTSGSDATGRSEVDGLRDSSVSLDSRVEKTPAGDAAEVTQKLDSTMPDRVDPPEDSTKGCTQDCTSTVIDCQNGPCECPTGSICDIDCLLKSCPQISCNIQATCNIDCTESVCNTVTCQSGSKCSMMCADALCNGMMTCEKDSECSLECEAGNCHSMTCKSGAVCNFDCTASDCREIQCLEGSTCNIDCRHGSCGTIFCAADSTCNVECDDATCDVQCDEAATCSCLSGTSLSCNTICSGKEAPCTN